jgi:DNA-binding NtrC family response regulator
VPDVGDSVRTLMKNPFGGEPSVWRAAVEHVRTTDIGDLVSRLLFRGDVLEVKRVLLAVGHVAAIDDPTDPARVLGVEVLPRRVEKKLPRSRGDYLAVVMAAGRCYHALCAMHGRSSEMQRVRRETWAACFGETLLHTLTLQQIIHDHDVLILGETGTGKEAVARAIQDGTPGALDGSPAPRASLNAAAVPKTLIESELFGHVKGAFTGAAESRAGKIRSADGGSFFLDEVGDLDETTQVKLLRVMETDEVYPLGSDVGHETHVRYIAATHKDLWSLVESGRYRKDLYNRLAGSVIELPALRDRPEDVPPIGEAFLERHLPQGALPDTRRRTLEWLASGEAQRYPWPGNVRELQNALRNMLLGLDAGIGEGKAASASTGDVERLPPTVAKCVASLKDVEDWYLRRVLTHTNDNFAHSARILGVDRTTIRRKAKKLQARRRRRSEP